MQENSDEHKPLRSTAGTGRLRLAIGFLQGIVGWWLLRLVPSAQYVIASNTGKTHSLFWSERHPLTFAAMALVTAFIPAIAIAEVGRMRRKPLLVYLALASAAVAGLAAYDLWRDPIQYFGSNSDPRVWPSFQLSFCTALGLFIVNQLLEHRERGHALFAAYAEHFEDSWMRGFQLIVALIFSLLVWGVLELGAALFGLIHISAFRTMIEHNWFRCPALAMAFAAAVHLTDVRPALLRGMRNVGLTLLSWLLPLVVALTAAFLLALLFVGLKPLWSTRHAASILLWACAITLFFLNAAYKDGDPSNSPPVVLRWVGRIAGPTMLLLSLIASYAILMRVRQYGWTPDRVLSTAVAFTALVYSLGYTYAALRRGPWLSALQLVNVSASLVILAIFSVLLTPLVDPERVSVDSQMRRLARGEVAPGKFDYQFLRFDSGRFGTNALDRLSSGASAEVRSRATLMQGTKGRSYLGQGEPNPAATEPAFSHAAIFPEGTRLPEDFRNADWSRDTALNLDCLRNGASCDIYVLPYGSTGEPAVIVRPDSTKNEMMRAGSTDAAARLFQRDPHGKWVQTGTFNHLNCAGVVAALREGQFVLARPEHDDLVVAGVRLHFSAGWRGNDSCAGESQPKPPSAQDRARDADAPPHMGPAFGEPK